MSRLIASIIFAAFASGCTLAHYEGGDVDLLYISALRKAQVQAVLADGASVTASGDVSKQTAAIIREAVAAAIEAQKLQATGGL